ncbi:MAG: oxidoreductase [Candidatus Latescibacteria bacterium]|nr:oxidoreductase [bacterium]MBD3425035.1 oxidoreductase [Candidatus Latescibacterota bacterium]
MDISLTEEGPTVSRIAHGMMRLSGWNADARGILELVERSIQNGITTFDQADIYGNYSCEELFGEALALSPSIRDRMQIITKCGIVLPPSCGNSIKHYDTSPEHITESVEKSLRKLRTDYIDILLIHRPDPIMDVEGIADTFSSLKRSGKVLHFGVSNFTPRQFEYLAERLDFNLVTNQIECSVLELSPFLDGTIDTCVRYRCSPMAWSPLAGGELFTGRNDRISRIRKTLEEIRIERNLRSIDIIALAWVLMHPSRIIPLIGTGNPDRVDRAVTAIDLKLSRTEWFRIWSASTGRDVP